MSVYPPPTRSTSIFNSTDFGTTTSSTVTQTYVDTYYLKKAGGQTVLALETFQGGIATNSIAPYAGTTVDFGANNMTTTGNLSATNLTGSGTVTCSRLVNSGNIQSFTTLPTLSSNNIGYSAIYTLATTTNVAAQYNVIANTGSLPVGVWRVDVVASLAATTANYTLTGFYVGISDSATALATYSNTVGGFRYDKYSASYTVVFNDGRFQPTFNYNQTLTLSAATTVYGFFYLNQGSGGTLTLTTNSYIQVTRLA